MDITDRKRIEQALNETKRQLKLVLDTVPAMIWQKDRSGRYVQVNNAYCQNVGRTETDVLGKTDHDLFDADFASHYVRADRRILATGNAELGIEERHQKPSGEIGWSRKDKMAYTDEQGNIAGTIGFAVDITAIKAAEEQVRHLQKSESQGRMAGAIAHNFNNWLSVVMGNIELAVDCLSDDTQAHEHLAEAMKAVRKCAGMCGLMLTYLGQGTGLLEPLDLSRICLQNHPLFQEGLPKNITLALDCGEPGPVVRANVNEMRQVITHLITNAAEAIGDGPGKIDLVTKTIAAADIPKSRRMPSDWNPATDHLACLEVRDTGCGMDEEVMDRIFDPFFTTGFTGRGLGLPVVFGITKSLDGAIGLESQKGRGSVFPIYLPLIANDFVLPQTEKDPGTGNMPVAGTVLLVEDQAPVREMLCALLTRMGLNVLAAACGTDAIALFHRYRDQIGCVLTDLSMPEMDGYQVMNALRRIQPDIPVILTSGYDEARAMGRRDTEQQPNAFLHKPYSKDELKKALDQSFRRPNLRMG